MTTELLEKNSNIETAEESKRRREKLRRQTRTGLVATLINKSGNYNLKIADQFTVYHLDAINMIQYEDDAVYLIRRMFAIAEKNDGKIPNAEQTREFRARIYKKDKHGAFLSRAKSSAEFRSWCDAWEPVIETVSETRLRKALAENAALKKEIERLKGLGA